MSTEISLERRIIIGLIVSDEYISQVRKMWNVRFLQSDVAKRIGTWCIEYYDKYTRAPFDDIEGIYFQKLKNQQVPKDLAEEIEEEILPDLNEEYERGSKFNHQYLLDQTKEYFKERHLEMFSQEIKAMVQEGNLDEAESFAMEYQFSPDLVEPWIDLHTDEAIERMEKAFDTQYQNVVKYPGAAGRMWNNEFVRGALVSFLAPEKRGKSFRLLDIAVRGVRSKSNVVYFQAGDMTEGQQLVRIGEYLSKKSRQEENCGEQYIPVKDCIWNQIDKCDREERECGFGPFPEMDEEEYMLNRDFDMLTEGLENEPKYKPCHNCKEDFKGTVWYKKENIKGPLTGKEAGKKAKKFMRKYKNRFRLSTHSNSTLSIKDMETMLTTWEKQDGFIPDVIIVDYADLLISPIQEYRHKQDEIWKGLRRISQEKHCLVVTATQSDADSYKQDRLTLSNYSEDKRKYAHVTAMYGLNQDKNAKEKRMGLMRVNQLVVRETFFSIENEITIIQALNIGRPHLGSF